VGITNAVNLLDNMDGLAAGVCGISALAMAGYCLMESGAATVPAVFALAGACAGFLIYNFNPAKIFMGDCGSMFLGFSLAALAVQGTQRTAPNLMLSMLVPVAVLAIPIFDTTLVSVARTLHGRSISQGGRDHSSHRLVALGLSERSTVLALYTLTAIFGGLALATTRMPLSGVLVVGAVAFMALMNLGLYLGFLKVYTEPSDAPAHVRLIGGMVQHKKQLLQVGIDLMLAPAAFVGAHLLRFEGRFPPEHAEAVLAALPFVVVTKLVGLAVCKAYRGVWRYAGLADAITATAGSMLGSIFTLVVLGTLTGFHHLSRAALFVDWLMFTMLVVASRTGYVMLREVFGLLPPQHGPRVVILGAGVEVITLLHRLRDPLSPQRAYVVGILDNDRGKRGRTLNGAPVLGPVSDLPALIDSQEITFCVLGVSPLSESGRRILEYCEELNITVHRDLDTPPLAMTGERLVPATA